jgi:hypothetical protein
MSEMPDLTALADTDVGVEVAGIAAGEPWMITELAGLQFYAYGRQDDIVGEVMPQSGDRLHIVRNPENRHDRNACEVWWRNSFKLGHLPRGLVYEVAPALDAGKSLRAYVYKPGNGEAWSLCALLVGEVVAGRHADWLAMAVRRAVRDNEAAEAARRNVGRNNGTRFADYQATVRRERLFNAVTTFIRRPFVGDLPAVGSTVEVDDVADALSASRSTAFRLIRNAGATTRSYGLGWYTSHTNVTINEALYEAMQAWCRAPRNRVSRDQIRSRRSA